jgi:hypothetical protein
MSGAKPASTVKLDAFEILLFCFRALEEETKITKQAFVKKDDKSFSHRHSSLVKLSRQAHIVQLKNGLVTSTKELAI